MIKNYTEWLKQFLNEAFDNSKAHSDMLEIIKTLHSFSNEIKFRTEEVNGHYNIVYDDPKGTTEDSLKKMKNRKFWNTEFAPTIGKFRGSRVNITFGKSVQDMLNIKDFDQKNWSSHVVAENVTPAKANEVDPKELEVGKQVEMEHTTDEKEAERIALQHLAENPNYYTGLKKAGLIDEPEALQKAKELDEMAESDIHFKAIIMLWNKSDAQGRRRILDAVGQGVHDLISLKKELREMGYDDILDVEKALDLEEPTMETLS